MTKTKLNKKVMIALLILFFVTPSPFLANAISAENYQLAKANLSRTEIINISNVTRKELGLQPLFFSSELTKLAKLKMIDMQTNHYFEHYSPTGKSLKNFLNDVNYNYIYAGENLAKNYNNNNKLVQAWLDSPTHRRNMLHPDFEEVGIAFDYVNLNGVNQLVVVIIFGKKNL